MVMTNGRAFFGALSQELDARGNHSCAKCHITLQESITGCRELEDGSFMCSDCYFEDLGDALEDYPFAAPTLVGPNR